VANRLHRVTSTPRVSIVSLGCSRNDVDSEELAGRLLADGWAIEAGDGDTDVILVNTCGFIEQAKKDSIDTLLQASDLKEAGKTAKVVAVGCMAQRYGKELAAELPEADAIFSFDDYTDIGSRLRDVLDGRSFIAHDPIDRRTMLPISPVDRRAEESGAPGMGPHIFRSRLDQQPWAPLKIASGCDRRCTFCAIPAFRGSFVSRSAQEILEEASWLGQNGVREVFLVSENSTSYGKDIGDLRMLEKLLPALAQLEGIERVRVSYLQPAEIRPDLIRIIAQTPGVVPYLDLSFQHASNAVLRRMKRFGDSESFMELLNAARVLNPAIGARTNFIVGFPGETEQDVEILAQFINDSQLDAIGVFPYSDEDGTAAVTLDGHLPEDEVQARFDHISSLAERVTEQAASARLGSTVSVLIETDDNTGRAEHQGPEVDGNTAVMAQRALHIGEIVQATVIGYDGIDLISEMIS